MLRVIIGQNKLKNKLISYQKDVSLIEASNSYFYFFLLKSYQQLETFGKFYCDEENYFNH